MSNSIKIQNSKFKIIFLVLIFCFLPKIADAGIIIRPVLNTGLVGYWDFQEGAGNMAYDKSGYDNHGLWSHSAGHWADGQIGRAVEFDGGGEYVSASDVNEIDGVSQFSMSAWYYRTSSDHIVTIEKGLDNDKINMNLNGTTLYASIANGLNSAAYVTYTGTGWNHIAMVFDGTQSTNVDKLKVYINGNYVVTDFWNDSAIPSVTSTNSGNLLIGRSDTYGINSTGKIDEVRIYNRALNTDEISRLYKLSSIKINASQNNKLTNGLVGYWSFNGSDIDGSTVIDRSGQSNNGTITGATKIVGRVGQALDFDGSGDYVGITDNSIFDLNASNSYSWSFWINPKDFTFDNWHTVWSQDVNSEVYFYIYAASFDYFQWGPVTNGLAVGWHTTLSDYIMTETSNNALAPNTWSHVVVVYDGSRDRSDRLRIYINSTDMTTGTEYSGYIDNISTLNTRIGANQVFGEYFDGIIDEVRVYNRALEQSEITALYNTGLTKINAPQNNKLTSGLVGYWSFNGSDISGTDAFDRSGQGNHGVISGATPTIGKVGQGLSFDGSSDYVGITDNSIFDLNASNSYSWSFWINPKDFTSENWHTVWSQDVNSYVFFYIYAGNCDYIQWGPVTNGLAIGWMTASGDYIMTETSNNALAPNTWSHVVVVYDGSKDRSDRLRIYVNSTDMTTGTEYSGDIDNISTLNTRIGANQVFGEYFDGIIDEVRVYNRALTPAEILRLYNLGR